MISDVNKPVTKVDSYHIVDFTVEEYRKLLQIAKRNFLFVRYHAIPLNTRFVLWRHDCDYSLNRASCLAHIEQEEGVVSTFFLNPHCEFYNPFEKSQAELVKSIIEAGHDIGLHFDASFYNISVENQLDNHVANEALLLKQMFGVMPVAFSFHNPTSFLLTCEKEAYGGLLNCYSKRFKTGIPYCSDSNGYWRFRRLRDVLESAQDLYLQVLTHPGWWQETVLSPRERVFRCIQGRANATMRQYDETLKLFGRSNLGCLDEQFDFLKAKMAHKAELLDYRWMRGETTSVFVDLWRIFEMQLVKFCRIWLRKQLRAPASEVNAIITSSELRVPMYKVFSVIYGSRWIDVSGKDEKEYESWQEVRNCLVHGLDSYPKAKLQDGIIFLVSVMQQLATFGIAHPLGHDGLSHAGQAGLPRTKVVDGACNNWVHANRQQLGISDKQWQRFVDKLALN